MARRKKKNRVGSVMRELLGWLFYILIIIGLTYLIITYVGQRTRVSGSSMEKTLSDGDNLIVDKLSYRFQEPKRFDIVVFPYKYEENTYYIKRIIGLPGDTVACKGSGEPITVNGKPIDESAYLKSGVNPSDSPFSVTVTDGNVFVLGDNRSNSRDSRYHLDDGNNGLVPYDDIQGVALFRFWPFTRIGILN